MRHLLAFLALKGERLGAYHPRDAVARSRRRVVAGRFTPRPPDRLTARLRRSARCRSPAPRTPRATLRPATSAPPPLSPDRHRAASSSPPPPPAPSACDAAPG